MDLQIVSYQPKHQEAFRELNIAWLEKYFHVEDKDRLLLNNCKESILDKGGYIFMAEFNGETIGCFSLIPYAPNIFELGKMAVSPEYQGLKSGQKLLCFAVNFAKEHNWEALVLYSSTKLPTALHVYRKFGFQDIALEKDLPYARSNVKMKLTL
jgi:GNAT superfamily N-acetyltransferase